MTNPVDVVCARRTRARARVTGVNQHAGRAAGGG